MTPEICPHCGAEVPPNARACPECGSDEETGWSEQARADNLGLPDENFNYEEFVKREFEKKAEPRNIPWFWWVIGIFVLAGFAWLVFRR
jgi:hypothetical protein